MTSTPEPYSDISYFDFVGFKHRLATATHPEQFRDILCLIYDELSMRRHGHRIKVTGFERASCHDLRIAFYCTLNQMITMWSNARN